MTNPFELAEQAAAQLREQSGVDAYDVAVVLGSGWQEGAVALGAPSSEVATSSLLGFAPPSVAGHVGRILSIEIGGRKIALLAGRVHLYEGHSASEVVHPVRTMIAAGAKKVVLTNACGGLLLSIPPGHVVMIRDHINLTATSPLEGLLPPEGYRGRFVDLSDLYSARLRHLVHETVPGLNEAVYLGVRGPHYETPAEIEMAGVMGATVVGMSTVLEAIAARHLDAEVLGLGLVSNFAAGIATGPLSHSEVLEAGQSAATSLGEMLAKILPVL